MTVLDIVLERFHPRTPGRSWQVGPAPVELVVPDDLACQEVIAAYYEPAAPPALPAGLVVASWAPGVFDEVQRLAGAIPEGDPTLVVEDQAESKDECKAIFLFERGKRRIFAALSTGGAGAYLTVTRCARALSVASLIERGVIPFHASCIVMDDRAVCFTGDKRAGKTTTLVNLMRAGAGRFVSNDKVYLLRGPRSITVFAVPRAVNIRDGTFQALGLETLLPDVRSRVSTDEARSAVVRRSRYERWSIAPRLFAQCMNAGIEPAGEVASIVLPHLTDTEMVRLERMDVAQACRVMTSQILPNPFPHDSYWQALVASSPPMPAPTAVGEWLAEWVPAYHLYASDRTNDQVPCVMRSACLELGRGIQ